MARNFCEFCGGVLHFEQLDTMDEDDFPCGCGDQGADWDEEDSDAP